MQKRQAIIDGAKKAFQQYGVSDTSMDKIAETAQVSKRTVYNHFESKEILVTHIIRDIWSRNILTYAYDYDPTRDLRCQLSELIANELSFMSDQNTQDLVRVAMGYCLFNPDMFTGELKEFFNQETTLIRWIKSAMSDGKLRDKDPIQVSDQLLSLLKGQAFWPQLLHQDEKLSDAKKAQLIDDTLDLFLSYYQN